MGSSGVGRGGVMGPFRTAAEGDRVEGGVGGVAVGVVPDCSC